MSDTMTGGRPLWGGDNAEETIQWCPRCERGAGSAATCPACGKPTVERQPDPLGVVPASFVSDWSGTDGVRVGTIPAALKVAEEAPSTTDDADMPRCRYCGSVTVHYRPEGSTLRVCGACDERFDESLPPRSEIPTREGGDTPVCPDCGSFRLQDGFSGEIECLDCSWLGTEAVDAAAFVEPAQATLGEVSRDA